MSTTPEGSDGHIDWAAQSRLPQAQMPATAGSPTNPIPEQDRRPDGHLLDVMLDARYLGRSATTTWEEDERFEGADETDLLELLEDAVNRIHNLRRARR